jgi:proteasome assembly chaperone 3
VFISVTQIEKFGTFLRAYFEDVADSSKIYHIETILGRRDDPLLTIYARQIIERLAKVSRKQLLLSISLREEGRSPQIFQAVIDQLFDVILPLL